jgi:acyl carrier protein
MDKQDIRATLCELVPLVDENLAGRLENLDDNAMLRDGLGLDSLQVTEFLFEIEEKFDIKIEDEEAMNLRNIGDLIQLVERKVDAA